MDIVIISHFCDNLAVANNDRFLYVANLLATEHSVEVITSDFFHTAKRRREEAPEGLPFSVTMLHEPGYSQNICMRRFYSHFIWGKNVGKYLRNRKVPDVIYCAIPSLTAAVAAARYCKKHNVRFVIDVQDLWPEAFQMVFSIPIISRCIFFPFRKIADYIYGSADSICAVSETYADRALKVNKKSVHAVPVFLGTDLAVFDENVRRHRGDYKKRDEPVLAYCGTLGASYDLFCVFDALDILRKRTGRLVTFIVMGSGPRQEEFEEYARNLGLDVSFMDRLPYDEMCALLASCDIAVNPIRHGAAQSIINKHADYAAAGIPVISTQESEEYRRLVETYGMGINCDSAEDVAMALERLLDAPSLRQAMGKNARACAEEKFDRATSYKKIVGEILNQDDL